MLGVPSRRYCFHIEMLLSESLYEKTHVIAPVTLDHGEGIKLRCMARHVRKLSRPLGSAEDPRVPC